MPKPSDFFVGIIDFFAVLLPGAALTYLLLHQSWFALPFWPLPVRGGAEGWAVFLFSAYVLGHVLVALGSALLDPLYDRFYAKYQRVRPVLVRRMLVAQLRKRRKAGKRRAPWALRRGWWRLRWSAGMVWHRRAGAFAPDPLLAAARLTKRRELAGMQRAGLSPDQVSNTLYWAGSMVRLKSETAHAEIARLQADSKFFRSLALVALFAAAWIFGRYRAFPLDSGLRDDLSAALLIALTLLLVPLAVWRFAVLRWNATERTYEYYIALSLLEARAPTNSRTADQ